MILNLKLILSKFENNFFKFVKQKRIGENKKETSSIERKYKKKKLVHNRKMQKLNTLLTFKKNTINQQKEKK